MPRVSPQQLRVLRALDRLARAVQERQGRQALARERPGIAVDYADLLAESGASKKNFDFALKRLETLDYVRKVRHPGWTLTLAGVIAADESPPSDVE